MGTPLRGELTRTVSLASSQQPTMDHNLENIQGVLSQFTRLSRPTAAQAPKITISNSSESLDEATQDAAASWSWTVAEAASTEAILFPFLIHLAAARNDVDALNFCLTAPSGAGNSNGTTSDSIASPSVETPQYGNVGGGLVNSVEPGSGRSPLHVAALNGHTLCANILLKSGALVHLRDTLGHTALYYVRLNLSISLCQPLRRADAMTRLLGKVTRMWWTFWFWLGQRWVC